MTLENLLKIGQLKVHSTDRLEVGRLLEAARRNLADAEVEAIRLATLPKLGALRQSNLMNAD